MKRCARTILCAVCLCITASCDRMPSQSSKSIQATPCDTVADSSDTVQLSLHGHVRYASSCDGQLGGPAAGVIVFLIQPLIVPDNTRRSTELTIANGQITPWFSAVFVGEEVIIRSGDGDAHYLHVESKSKKPFANTGPPEVKEFREVFPEAETLVHLICKAHGTEEAWLTVIPPTAFCRTDDRGYFRLRVPSMNRYKIAVIHPTFGRKDYDVTSARDEGIEIALGEEKGDITGRKRRGRGKGDITDIDKGRLRHDNRVACREPPGRERKRGHHWGEEKGGEEKGTSLILTKAG